MDESWEKWFSDLEMDDDELHLFNEHNMNSLEEELMKIESSVPYYDSYFANSSSSNNNNMGNGSCLERNTQHANSNSEKNQMVITPCTLSFEDSTVVSNVPDESFHAKPEKRRSISQTSKHIMVERKRREKISTLLIELSAMLPGLKKMDKLSIISKTIDYVKYLQNRIKDLQEVNNKRGSIKYCKNNNTNVNISENSNDLDSTFLKIDSSVSGKDVRISVICEKREQIVSELLSKLASHNLSMVCSSVLPLGSSILNISIICKVEQCSMAIDELVKSLYEDLLKLYKLQN
ncbi:transcription factor bHLH18-like [Vigna unguiculata]|uniref:transcription factor bHLH18-like n=1 Tax=Vigna unguiculata TaxID=3917 RepID=UPI0010161F8B|nr:transcription factor bHLH18-like [Vigna unguiculata]